MPACGALAQGQDGIHMLSIGRISSFERHASTELAVDYKALDQAFKSNGERKEDKASGSYGNWIPPMAGIG